MKLGFIWNGKYQAGSHPHKGLPMSSMFRDHERDMQRQDHQRDILQPYLSDGTPNEAFIEAYPQEAKLYGMRGNDGEED